MRKLLSLLTAVLLAGSMWAADIVVTLENIGAGLGDAANTTMETTNITAKNTTTSYTLNYYQCKKQGNAMLMTKSVSPFISNHTAMPGDIKSVKVYINSGAAKATTYDCAFSATECTSATSGIGAVNITGGNNHTYDNPSVTGKRYFCITLGNANNGQVLSVEITCASATEPSVSLSSSILTLNPTDVANQEITVTCSNFASSISSLTAGLYSNAECTSAYTIDPWITGISVNDAKTKVTFSVANNSGAQRQAWLKVTATDGTSTESAILAITQKKAPLATMQEIYDEATANGSTAKEAAITFNSWVVSGKSTYNAYVTDGTKGFVININNHGYEVGDILTGTAYVDLKLSSGKAIISAVNSGNIAKTEGGVITPVIVSINNLSGVNTGAPIIVQNVTYNGTSLVDASSNAIKPYNELYNDMSFTNGKTYNVKGIYLQYNNTTKEILPRSAADIAEIPAVSVSTDAIDFGTVGVGDDAPAAESFTITGTNLTEALSIANLTNFDYAITAGSLTPADGAVNATITVTPKEGFTDAVANKGETLTISGGGLAANKTVTISAVVKARFTITWDNNGNKSVKTSVIDGQKPVFPSTPSSCDETSTTFYGWATAAWGGKAANLNEKTVYTKAADMPDVDDDITYYAVFAAESENDSYKWVLTALNAVSEGTYAIVNQTNHAFNGTVNSSGHGDCTTGTFTFTNGEASEAPTGTCEITIAIQSDGFSMYNTSTSKYLYASQASSGGLAEQTDKPDNYWHYNNNWEYNKLYSTKYAVLRSYDATTGGLRVYGQNSGNGVIQLAKKTATKVKSYTDYMTTCSGATALDEVENVEKAVKVLRNGVLYIEKDGKTYNAQGQLVK